MAAYFGLVLALILAVAVAALDSKMRLHDIAPNNPSSFPRSISRRWIFPRPAEDDVWEAAICKGRNLFNAVAMTDKEAAKLFLEQPKTVQSEFKEWPESFINWGYHQFQGTDVANIVFEDYGYGIADALRGLRVSDKLFGDGDGQIRTTMMCHGRCYDDDGNKKEVKNQIYKHNGKIYKYTGAEFMYGVDPENKVLMMMNVKSPEHVVDWPSRQLPDLRRASDVMFGLWKLALEEVDETDLGGLRYFILIDVVNPIAGSLVVRACGSNEPKEIGDWPGHDFSFRGGSQLNDNALAMLGSPVAMSLGYMLVQHKQEFKGVRIESVNVFMCNGKSRQPCLVFHLWRPSSGADTPP